VRGQPDLLEVRQTTRLARLFACLGEDGEENGGEDRNDVTAEKIPPV
jgi:hypothetical protein